MGCHDDACVVCGAPPRVPPKKTLEEIYRIYGHKLVQVKSQAQVNSQSTHNHEHNTQNHTKNHIQNKISKTLKWLERCTILLSNGETVHDVKHDGCSTGFYKNKDKYEGIDCINHLKNNKYISNGGIWVHTDCYKFCSNFLNVKLNFSMFHNNSYGHTKTHGPLFPRMMNYLEQDFDFMKVFKNNEQWLLSSPLNDDKHSIRNIARIKRVLGRHKLTPSVVKAKLKSRITPFCPASLRQNLSYMVGMNNKVWRKMNGKWVEQKDYKVLDINTSNKIITKIKPLFKKSLFNKYHTSNAINPVFILKYHNDKLKLISNDAGYKKIISIIKNNSKSKNTTSKNKSKNKSKTSKDSRSKASKSMVKKARARKTKNNKPKSTKSKNKIKIKSKFDKSIKSIKSIKTIKPKTGTKNNKKIIKKHVRKSVAKHNNTRRRVIKNK